MLATSRDSAMSYSKLLDLVSGRLRPRCSTRVPHTAQSWLSSASPVSQRTVLTPSPVNQCTLFTQRHTDGPGECHKQHSRESHQHYLSINVHYSHHHLSINVHYSHSGTQVVQVSATHITVVALISIICQSMFIIYTITGQLDKPIISPISYVCL